MFRLHILMVPLLTAAGLSLILPVSAQAASCCGGASVTDQFVVPKWERALVGLSMQVSHDLDMRNAAGERINAQTWSNTETRLIAGGAHRLGTDWQAGLSLPLVVRHTTAGDLTSTGYGIGDIGLQLRYEIIDEDTCFLRPFRELAWNELKPSLHLVMNLTAPTGRPTHRSTDNLAASVTGRGYWMGDTGLQVTKVWGQWGNSLEGSIGYQLPTSGNPLHPALRWSVGGSALFYPAYRKYVGVHLGYREELAMGTDDSAQAALTASLLASWVPTEGAWWLRGSFGPSGYGIGRNTPVSWQGLLTLAKTFP